LHRKSNKGRKKKIQYQGDNLYDLIHKYVVPKWRQYLLNKCSKSDKGASTEPRVDTIWKKILRDAREFFRIMFRVRFHYLDFKDTKGAQNCLEIMFEELGIPLSTQNTNDISLFTYIHQSHKSTSTKLFKKKNVVKSKGSPFNVIENFNESSRKKFMKDPLASKLFYFVFQNFLDVYFHWVSAKYVKNIVFSICMILRCYKRMEVSSHLDRICFLLD